ncbi:trypsin-like peptidase domain-containing protein [Saccharothrix sp. NPDC042600]|uniref:trypsin-like peptidase domain-containing protein n=1 Tax=Saccharothrix TaxID=2071 RepID=UPI00340793E0
MKSFVSALRRAARGVARVQVGGGGNVRYCTGWLITDDLLVLADYAVAVLDAAERFRCLFATEDVEVEADLVPTPKDGCVAVVRLRSAREGRALRLGTAEAARDQPVVVLHHPRAAPRLFLSTGRILAVEPPWLYHDADSEGGSGGGPAVDMRTGTVVGMHSGWAPDREQPRNRAVSVSAVLDSLRASTVWDEIAAHQGLADVTAAREALDVEPVAEHTDHDLVPAAVRWSFDPEDFPEDVRRRLHPLVADPGAPSWALTTPERQRLIGIAGSLPALRAARGAAPVGGDGGQRTIDRILAGPPYALDDVADQDLPYWLQAVRWFSGVAPDLPAPLQVNRALERRRVVGRLREVAGPGFRGRTEELAALRAWFDDPGAGPMVITGIGGIGKSALVARFAEELLPDTVLLWLDFDRADLAPDDARSVLDSVREQAAVQVDGFAAPRRDEWEDDADEVALALARSMPAAPGPLLVLDGFEVAQHAVRHDEIWPVLERLLVHLPDLRIVVSGRATVSSKASVTGLELGGRPSRSQHLRGLTPAVARRWLVDRGIGEPTALDYLVKTSRGVPLVLKLAIRLIEAGGDVRELPRTLPRTLIEGYLYQRILDRVIDPALKLLARDALVLRVLNADVVREVLHDVIPPGLDAERAFTRLSRELGLVEGLGRDTDTTMRLRPEVRISTLRLVEADDLDRVHEIDRRAADFYAGCADPDAATTAELVYHLLRCGDLKAAELAWRDDCAPLLRHAWPELPDAEEEAQEWLRLRTEGVPRASADVAAWEREAVRRIGRSLARGLERAVPAILHEVGERRPDSPLVVYDAWADWQAGDLKGARRVLASVGFPPGRTGRDRAVLGAALAREAGDGTTADRLLARVDGPDHWPDDHAGRLSALAVRAARIRLTVDLAAELDLADARHDDVVRRLSGLMSGVDVVLPSLAERFDRWTAPESAGRPLAAPSDAGGLTVFAAAVEAERKSRRRLSLRSDLRGAARVWRGSDATPEAVVLQAVPRDMTRPMRTGRHLVELADRRWRLATTSPFIARACEQAARALDDPLTTSVVGTLAALRGMPFTVAVPRIRYSGLDEVIGSVATQHTSEPDRMARRILDHEAAAHGWSSPHLRALALYLVGPDPLDVLHRHTLGLPLAGSKPSWSDNEPARRLSVPVRRPRGPATAPHPHDVVHEVAGGPVGGPAGGLGPDRDR